MDRYNIWLIGILLSISQGIIGQETIQTSRDTNIDTIPFQLTAHNNLSIKAVVNKQDTVDLMFHTASSGVTLIKKATEKLKTIEWNQGDKVNSWGGENEARYSTSNTVQIGTFQWDSLPIWETEHSGPTTDGKFGLNLFQGKVVEIDFDNSWLIIQQTVPPKIAAYQKLELDFEQDFLFIEGMSMIGDQGFANRYLIHSGYGGTILYDDKFVKESKIGNQITITEEQELKDSYGNILKTKKGNVPQFTIGTEIFEELPVGFFEGAIGRQKISVMGGNLLKRFNLIIDAKREYIYLQPNQLRNLAYK